MKFLNHFKTKKNMVYILETDALTKEEIRAGCRYVMDSGCTQSQALMLFLPLSGDPWKPFFIQLLSLSEYTVVMLYLFVPLYSEAADLIHHLQLKKRNYVHGIDSFVSADGQTVLTLTGGGKDSAIAVISAILAVLVPGRDDFMLMFGSGAGTDSRMHGLYQACVIEDEVLNRRYYPDMMWKTDVPWAYFVTVSAVKGKEELQAYRNSDMPVLVDMESAGACYAGSRHLGPHQMLFLRFVSDNGESVRAEDMKEMAAGYTQKIVSIMDMLESVKQQQKNVRVDEALLEETARYMHASVTMERQLRQLFVYAAAAGVDLSDPIRDLMKQECRTREEGKKVLHVIAEMLDA